jgi:hypothetical protein
MDYLPHVLIISIMVVGVIFVLVAVYGPGHIVWGLLFAYAWYLYGTGQWTTTFLGCRDAVAPLIARCRRWVEDKTLHRRR